jgi:hypothetical protein
VRLWALDAELDVDMRRPASVDVPVTDPTEEFPGLKALPQAMKSEARSAEVAVEHPKVASAQDMMRNERRPIVPLRSIDALTKQSAAREGMNRSPHRRPNIDAHVDAAPASEQSGRVDPAVLIVAAHRQGTFSSAFGRPAPTQVEDLVALRQVHHRMVVRLRELAELHSRLPPAVPRPEAGRILFS